MEFKDRLKYLRRNYIKDGKKLTQEKLGQILGYKYTSISNYESGRNEPCIKDLIKLAQFFGVSLDYLVCASDNEKGSDKTNELYDICSSFSLAEQEKLILIFKEIRELKDLKVHEKRIEIEDIM